MKALNAGRNSDLCLEGDLVSYLRVLVIFFTELGHGSSPPPPICSIKSFMTLVPIYII